MTHVKSEASEAVDDRDGKTNVPATFYASRCGHRMPGPIGFTCTSQCDHDGDHIAHGIRDKEHARWPQ